VYERARLPEGVTLRLDANEGPSAAEELVLSAIREGGGELLRRYPDTKPLSAALANRFGLDPSQVFVGAGADEVIDRCCRAFLGPRETLLIAEPGFEMFGHLAALCGARAAGAQWLPGRYPIDAMLRAIDDDVAIIALVTPNNPTGEAATGDDLRRLAIAAPNALVILDHAYVEFADEDLTHLALELPNVVVVRTFSKAWGLAGCRVGYALGPSSILRALRAAGGPYPVSAASLAIAGTLLERGAVARDAYVARIREERQELHDLLGRLGGRPRQTQANFVFAELGDRTGQVHSTLIQNGVLVRALASGDTRGLRISLPGSVDGFRDLKRAVERAVSAS
jgi:histidinol-phosphate aminotransferase